jgi:Rrf2 family transcriptional regulator, iron-sulfur cluster assembly transcription factor
MLKVSSKGRYAVRALSDLAFFAASEPAQIKDVARRGRIPLRFLEQIFQDLRRAGLVASKRGPRGGYALARPASEISVADVLFATDAAAPRPARGATSARDLRDVADQVLEDLAREVESAFSRVTLAEVCDKGERAGIGRVGHRQGRARSVYVI